MFQPALPFDGLVGWRLLQRTYDTQFDAFNKNPAQLRDTEYFRENIANVKTPNDLVSDRRLLSVALGAFGLQQDINNRFFIQKILEEGTLDEDSLANRFTDNRYKQLSEAFGFGAGEVQRNRLSDFPDEIISKFEKQSFEVAVGEQSQTLRIALAAQRSFEDIADMDSSENVKWFEVLGQPPLRKLFETTFNLPAAFGQADIDQQRETFARKSQEIFGTSDPGDFANSELQEQLITKYTAMSLLRDFKSASSGSSVALTLLRGF